MSWHGLLPRFSFLLESHCRLMAKAKIPASGLSGLDLFLPYCGQVEKTRAEITPCVAHLACWNAQILTPLSCVKCHATRPDLARGVHLTAQRVSLTRSTDNQL
jgi:hypothetical protein